jgi:hypothetical protein
VTVRLGRNSTAAWERLRARLGAGQRTFAALVLAGLVANAWSCATLSTPSEARLQYRVAWLLPLLALLVLFARPGAAELAAAREAGSEEPAGG